MYRVVRTCTIAPRRLPPLWDPLPLVMGVPLTRCRNFRQIFPAQIFLGFFCKLWVRAISDASRACRPQGRLRQPFVRT